MERTHFVGEDISRLRTLAGIKQSELAKRLGVDTSRISRSETGDVVLNAGELAALVKSIGSELALEYLDYMTVKWASLPNPGFWHPNRQDIREAEDLLASLERFCRENPDLSGAARAQVQLYRKTLQEAAEYLLDLEHTLTFTGEVGVGKTATICAANGMLLPDTSLPLSKRTALEVGAGRMTLCEVVVRPGGANTYGINVTPCASEDVYRLVSDFCASLVDSVAETERGSEQRGVTEEMGKALRNMAGLTRTKSSSEDPAVKLARSCEGKLDVLTAEMLKLMQLERRTKVAFSIEEEDQVLALTWLRGLFAQINKGLNVDIPLPKSIEVIVPHPVLGEESLKISLVDTKGVEETALRPDIRRRLDDPRSVGVLCTSFNPAPDLSVREILEDLVETGAQRAVSERVIVMVLPRGREALDTQDDEGNTAETHEEGYRLKGEQVKWALSKIKGAEAVPVHFCDILRDPSAALTSVLVQQLRNLRARYSLQIEEVGAAVSQLINLQERAATESAGQRVRARLREFADANGELPKRTRSEHALLLTMLGTRHARTVWASTRRNGSWTGLDAYYAVGMGTTINAGQRSAPFFAKLDALLSEMLSDPSLKAAHDYIGEIRRAAVAWREKFQSGAMASGRETTRTVLFEDDDLWNACEALWTQGRGFRSSVSKQIREWFERHTGLLDGIERGVAAAWTSAVLAPLSALIGDNLPEPQP